MAVSAERLLSLEDVADRLQVSDQSVRRWIKAGRLAAYKPGLEWRIKPSDLEDFLETRSFPKVQAALPSDDPQAARLEAFLGRCLRHVDARIAHYEQRLAEAEHGGTFAGPDGARTLFEDAWSEYLSTHELLNGEAGERWIDDPEIPEAVKHALGLRLSEIMVEFGRAVGRISEQETALAVTEEQRRRAREHGAVLLEDRRRQRAS